MSPRPRKVSDAEIFAAAHRVMMRATPAQLTLAEIGKEAGLTAGALVQRFGSKLGLLRALAARLTEESPQLFVELRARHRSPLAAIRDYAACVARMGESPGGLAHHLAYLQLDLTDAEMHRHLGEQARGARDAIRALLDDAVKAGELRRGTDTAALARAVQVAVSGSLMTSAFEKERPTTAMRKDVDAVVGPYRR
jgi:AcrR family transcriptional regulator